MTQRSCVTDFHLVSFVAGLVNPKTKHTIFAWHLVKFVRVQLSVNFVDLVTVGNLGSTTLRIKYFIVLPQTTHQMTNGAGNA